MTREITDQDLLNLTQEQTREIYAQGPEAVTWALLTLSVLARGKRAPAASTPSSQIPPYEKPAIKKGRKKRGREEGHAGTRRAAPPVIDRQEEHLLAKCPDCGGAVGPSIDERRRIIDKPFQIHIEHPTRQEIFVLLRVYLTCQTYS